MPGRGLLCRAIHAAIPAPPCCCRTSSALTLSSVSVLFGVSTTAAGGRYPTSRTATTTRSMSSSSHKNNGVGAHEQQQKQHDDPGYTLAALPKTWRFTRALPPDPKFPTPAASHSASRDQLGPRLVRGALFTWVRPEHQDDPELLAVSPAALRDLGIKPSEAATDDFRETAAGNILWGWDEGRRTGASAGAVNGTACEGEKTDDQIEDDKIEDNKNACYPWAQCYGGFQFGQWAGQLGDGRAISLFEVPVPSSSPLSSPARASYELQLKGAGITPYSRFADGRAVLRSSIREFVVSEALHALGIPSTRALALTLLPHERVHRERLEPGAIVARFAETWLRLGTFDLLPRLYREVVRRNARTVARWQAYGFMNGVLNTDNTSLLGLSLDFGPFAFLDNFDPAYTPNHDDQFLRYSYRNQPSVVWWNLVRFGEALGELLAAGPRVDDPRFVEAGLAALAKADVAAGYGGGTGDGNGVAAAADAASSSPGNGDAAASQPAEDAVEKVLADLASRAEAVIMHAGDEYKSVFIAEYKRLFAARLGLSPLPPPPPTTENTDEADTETMDPLVTGLLDVMEELELDFNLFFRRLSTVRTADLVTEEGRRETANRFFYREGLTGLNDAETGRQRITDWLAQWRDRVREDSSQGGEHVDEDKEQARIRAMKAVNPNFIPRGWILDEVIRRVEKEGERDVLRRIMHMALHPFADSWDGQEFDGEVYHGDAEEETRWTQDVPRESRAMQCSCSS
ncbi:putative protein family UPF0061 [Niveomyces insectorum RCEF 264]|uniref:Selenoprotein O n=1 Tax=Niveomyces insectorum RCEF 264 TaxID=1081102 RepID=A0A167X1E0_9HYPO|nr:putative protein family UPF0061 [Niveomyces insectorum RCEF 264]